MYADVQVPRQAGCREWPGAIEFKLVNRAGKALLQNKKVRAPRGTRTLMVKLLLGYYLNSLDLSTRSVWARLKQVHFWVSLS
jgi:hypothetical protein